jgi:hypothetical protein
MTAAIPDQPELPDVAPPPKPVRNLIQVDAAADELAAL